MNTYLQGIVHENHENHERHEKMNGKSELLYQTAYFPCCASSQAPAWEFSAGSSRQLLPALLYLLHPCSRSFPSREAGASLHSNSTFVRVFRVFRGQCV